MLVGRWSTRPVSVAARCSSGAGCRLPGPGPGPLPGPEAAVLRCGAVVCGARCAVVHTRTADLRSASGPAASSMLRTRSAVRARARRSGRRRADTNHKRRHLDRAPVANRSRPDPANGRASSQHPREWRDPVGGPKRHLDPKAHSCSGGQVLPRRLRMAAVLSTGSLPSPCAPQRPRVVSARSHPQAHGGSVEMTTWVRGRRVAAPAGGRWHRSTALGDDHLTSIASRRPL
jgi:hypothetical protein